MGFTIHERYNHKIKTARELGLMLGSPPRQNKVIMCHGVFDVVHPGHVRHLLYAKSKASVLVVSVTSDPHINKGVYRPHIPQDLRALNLAAYEFVDYVIIDNHETAINNIRILQPDMFAKGFEYEANLSVKSKTSEELNAVTEYGGQIIFTPGDIVYSSSSLTKSSPPQVQYEKLLLLMEKNNLSFESLKSAVASLSKFKVHVIGDTIIDSYTDCTLLGGQTKTPTISVRYESMRSFIGGAGIVSEHLHAAGAEVTFTSVIGDDHHGEFAQQRMKSLGIKTNLLVDRNRPTVNKNAIVVDKYRLLKIDTVDHRSISDQLVEQICSEMNSTEVDAVIFSDFRHGIFNKRTIPTLISAIPKGAYKVADSQVASRWGNITQFRHFDLITPNEREARFALADQDSQIRPLASDLYKTCMPEMLILKLGDKGILTCLSDDILSLESFFSVDSFVDNLVDPVGAGDALLAYTTLAMLFTKDPITASIIGSIAASCECEHDGNVPITPSEIMSKLSKLEKILQQ